MKIGAFSRGKLTLLLTAFWAVILASTDNAKAIGYPLPSINLAGGDRHELGQVLPGILAGDAARQQYVNFMIGVSLGDPGHVIINGQDSLVTRSNNDFGPFPGPARFVLTGEGMTVNLGTQGAYGYLLAKYDGPNAVSQVWYVGDLTGTIIIPAIPGEPCPSWALLGPTPVSVPDGGATVIMLGTALCILGVVRRYLLNQSS